MVGSMIIIPSFFYYPYNFWKGILITGGKFLASNNPVEVFLPSKGASCMGSDKYRKGIDTGQLLNYTGSWISAIVNWIFTYSGLTPRIHGHSQDGFLLCGGSATLQWRNLSNWGDEKMIGCGKIQLWIT